MIGRQYRQPLRQNCSYRKQMRLHRDLCHCRGKLESWAFRIPESSREEDVGGPRRWSQGSTSYSRAHRLGASSQGGLGLVAVCPSVPQLFLSFILFCALVSTSCPFHLLSLTFPPLSCASCSSQASLKLDLTSLIFRRTKEIEGSSAKTLLPGGREISGGRVTVLWGARGALLLAPEVSE